MHEATWAERNKYVGREAISTVTLSNGRTITRRYRILAVTRFAADGPLKAQVGTVDMGLLGVAGVYQDVDSLDLVPVRTVFAVDTDDECTEREL